MSRSPKNILVTGGAGFIGSAFIRYLLSLETFDGCCVNYDLLTYAGNLENLAPITDDPRYHFQQGDIRNQPLLEHICDEYEINTIVHFAAESHVDRSIEGPQTFLETNVLGTFFLLEVVRKLPHIHFHHVSTDEVYGQLGETGFFTEETPYDPSSPYSASKAASDHFVRAYARTYDLSTTISNCSNNYGPYQYAEKLIPLMIHKCLKKEPLPVYGEGQNIRDWLYVDDHAEALWLLLQKGRRGETYNIGGGEEKRNIEVVETIVKALSADPSLITYVEDRLGHDYRYAIDCSKLQNEFGWKPKHNFKEGITDTIAWYVKNQQWVSCA